MTQQNRSGFTLIELLVVIGIIGVLIGLTMSAVQHARMAAARTVCANNVRQIGLALHNHHAQHQKLPAGVTGPDTPQPFATWMIHVLPYLERDDLWRLAIQAFQQDKLFHDDPPHTARTLPVPVFSCPLDYRVRTPATFPTKVKVFEYGLTSYLGVEGTNAIRNDGLLYLDSNHRLTDALDGTGNTLLVGERPPSGNLRFGWWYAGLGQRRDGEADSVLGARTFCRRDDQCQACGNDPAHFQSSRFGDPCGMLHFWSPHHGGAHFLFADGAVKFLAYSADPILPALATRAGREAVSLPD